MGHGVHSQRWTTAASARSHPTHRTHSTQWEWPGHSLGLRLRPGRGVLAHANTDALACPDGITLPFDQGGIDDTAGRKGAVRTACSNNGRHLTQERQSRRDRTDRSITGPTATASNSTATTTTPHPATATSPTTTTTTRTGAARAGRTATNKAIFNC